MTERHIPLRILAKPVLQPQAVLFLQFPFTPYAFHAMHVACNSNGSAGYALGWFCKCTLQRIKSFAEWLKAAWQFLA